MRYIDVQWVSQGAENPVRLVSELDEQGYEVRKLEFFRDGRVGFAGGYGASAETRLGEAPVPSLEEINADPQFIAIPMEAPEFAALWRHYASSSA